MDAVFKPLHLWSSKEATGNEEKKIEENKIFKVLPCKTEES